jgi:autotransporter-associated beta strand protein
VGGALSQGTYGTINLNSGGTLQIGVGGTTGVLGVDALTNNGTLIFNRSDASTYSGVLSGSGALVKQGAGTLSLAGNNTSFGATTVSAGTLLINGSLANSAVTVGNGGALGGSGTIGSLVTVQSGGTLTPGNSPGLFTVASLDLLAGSTTLMQIVGAGSAAGIAGSDYDRLVISTAGGLGYGGTLDLDFMNTVPFADGTTFDLFGFSGSTLGHFSSVGSTGNGSYSLLTFSGVGGVWTAIFGSQLITFSELTGQLRFALNSAPVPEIDPGTGSSALSVVAGVLAMIEQRRRRATLVA